MQGLLHGKATEGASARECEVVSEVLEVCEELVCANEVVCNLDDSTLNP